MIKVATGAVLAGMLGLAGCAAPEPELAAAPQAAAAVRPMDQEAPVTGSRLAKRKTTDRMVKTVGAQDARDAMDSAPNPLKSE